MRAPRFSYVINRLGLSLTLALMYSNPSFSTPIKGKAAFDAKETSEIEFLAITGTAQEKIQHILNLIHKKKTKKAKIELDKLLSSEPNNLHALEIKGALLEDEGNYVKAEKLYLQITKVNPGNADIPARLSSLYLKDSKRIKSEEQAFKSLELDDRNPLALITLAKLHAEYGRLSKAVELYKFALTSAQERWKDPFPVVADLARLYNKNGQFGATFELLVNVVNKIPKISSSNQSAVVFLFAEACLRLREFDEAIKAKKLLTSWLSSSDVSLIILNSMLMHHQGRQKEAVSYLKKAITNTKLGRTDLQLLLFKFLAQQDDVNEASQVIEDAIFAENRSFVRSQMVQEYANFMIKLGKADTLLVLTAKLASEHPDDMQLGYLHASIQMNNDNNQDALKTLNKLIERKPKFSGAYTLRGKVLEKLGKHKQAISSMKKALNMEPGRINDWISLAYLTHKKEGHKGLLKILKEGLSKNPENIELQIEIARMHDEESAYQKANTLYSAILKRDENNLFALTAKSRNLALLGNNNSEVILLIERAKRLAPGDPYITSQYGWTYHLIGQHEKGLAFILQAAHEIPNNGQVHYRLAATYAALGDKIKAKTEANKSIKFGINKSERKAILTLLSKL